MFRKIMINGTIYKKEIHQTWRNHDKIMQTKQKGLCYFLKKQQQEWNKIVLKTWNNRLRQCFTLARTQNLNWIFKQLSKTKSNNLKLMQFHLMTTFQQPLLQDNRNLVLKISFLETVISCSWFLIVIKACLLKDNTLLLITL